MQSNAAIRLNAYKPLLAKACRFIDVGRFMSDMPRKTLDIDLFAVRSLDMNVTSFDQRLRVVNQLCEGMSVNATARITGVSKPTILRLLRVIGPGCQRLHSRIVRRVNAVVIQCDEAWSYVGKKEARVKPGDPEGFGDAYVYTALDADSRCIVSYRVGKRDAEQTQLFIRDLRSRLIAVPQISCDGWAPYVQSILDSFESVDFAQVSKNYRRGARRDDDHRYEPPRDPFITRAVIAGVPDPKHISTSLVEAQNRTIRMQVRRMTRLCDAFSKTPENHRAALALHFAHYNLVRIHESIGTAPAVAAKLIDRPFTLAELLYAALEEPPGEAPKREKLAPRPNMAKARALPNGSFLRLVGADERPPPPVVIKRVPVQLDLFDRLDDDLPNGE